MLTSGSSVVNHAPRKALRAKPAIGSKLSSLSSASSLSPKAERKARKADPQIGSKLLS